MTIYSKPKRVNYRKLWEQYHGCSIPKDEFGRTFEIHHIDGNRNNNSKENLLACSIKEHYDIHFKQEDWNACYAIASRMEVSPELLSELARKAALKRVVEGRHNLVGGEVARKRVIEKTHNLLKENGGSELARKTNLRRINDGSHHLLGPEHNLKLIAEGRHHLVGDGEFQRKQQQKIIEEGRHHLIGNVSCINKNGIFIRVSKKDYHRQKEITEDQTQWEFVSVRSREGKKRING